MLNFVLLLLVGGFDHIATRAVTRHSSVLDCLLFTQPPLTGQPP